MRSCDSGVETKPCLRLLHFTQQRQGRRPLARLADSTDGSEHFGKRKGLP